MASNYKFQSVSTDYSDSHNSLQQKSEIPRIPLNMREHKTALAITATILVVGNGILPPVLYFILKYAAHTSETIAITVPAVVFGVYSIFSMVKRLWSLLRRGSTTRPIGATKRHFDYFQINFMTLFVGLTVMIAISSALAGSKNQSLAEKAPRIFSMSHSVLMIIVCSEMVVVFITMSLAPSTTYPFRFSSMTKGEKMRPASYTIVEDIVAVDGKQGTAYRRQLNERYLFSDDIKALMKWADAVWGFSGVLLGGGLIAAIWVIDDSDIGFVLGWIVPWIWASLFVWLTIQRTKSACRKENARYMRETVYAPHN